ncbi:MAG TPA: DNA polymerase IV [Thermoplasmata archaeon]|nr:DNA polymerase IV [Thermoplasmata archaeon]
MEWVVYVDMDAFYVACELRERPDLRGRPVIVGPDPAQGPSRGVVLSASYEARAFGVKSAMPVAQAGRLCPEATWVRPDFSKYSRASKEVRALLASVVPVVVPLSIDEFAVRLEEPDADHAEKETHVIQDLIRDRLSLTASLGVAPSRTVAKIASDRAKPGGVIVVEPERTEQFLAPLSVRAISGVGPKTGELLLRHGIETIGDLRRPLPPSLSLSLGGFGRWMRDLARGRVRESDERSDHSPRSHTSDRTLEDDTTDRALLGEVVDGLADGLAEGAQEEALTFQAVTVALRWSDFDQTQHGRTLPGATDDQETLRATARRLLSELLAHEARGRGRAVRRVSVRIHRLMPTSAGRRTLDAFVPPTSN